MHLSSRLHARRLRRLAFGSLLLAGLPALGQTVPAPAPDSAATQDGDTVVLSPFNVDTTRDNGYAATASLSGTRLNTELRDTAAAVSVITPEFMRDLAVTNIHDLASFIVSTERDVQPYNNAVNNAGSLRIRGLQVDENSANFLSLYWRLDSYNLDRITQNRGPNSFLFGVGNPAGIISGSTKQARLTGEKISGSVGARFDSEGTIRGEVDVNQILVPGRAAVRIALLDNREEFYVDPTYWEEQRVFLTSTFRLSDRPSFRTTLRLEGELGKADRLLPQGRTARDQVTAWIQAGSPTVPGIAPAAPAAGGLPPGLIRDAGNNNIVVIDGTATAVPILNWRDNAIGARPTPIRFRIDGASVLPVDVHYPGTWRSSNYTGRLGTIFLEQQIGQNFFAEFVHFDHHHDLDWARDGGDDVFVDGNQTLPNGQPNPNVGRPFTQGNPRLETNYREARETRLTVAYLLDGTERSRWLGRHQLAGLFNRQWNEYAANDMREVNTTPLPGYNARLDNSQNQIIRRTYLFGNGGSTTGWLGGTTVDSLRLIDEGGVRSEFLNVQNVLHPASKVTGYTLGTQSFFLDDRLVVTYGRRHDNRRSYTNDPALTVRDSRGVLPFWQDIPLVLIDEQDSDVDTLGIVAHVLPQVSLFYNESETADTASGRRGFDGNPLPTPKGTGEDYGVKYSLFGGRLVGSVARFETARQFQPNFAYQNVPTIVNRIATALNRNDLLVAPDAIDTGDIEVEGYELELVYNPTANWRMAFNASKLSNEQANVNVRFGGYLVDNIFPLAASNGDLVLDNGRTVAQEVADLRTTHLNQTISQNGRPASELREWTFNYLTNYRFTEGRLRGFGVGGYIQYRGAPIIGLRLDPATGVVDPNLQVEGNAFTLVGMNVSYERRLTDRINWSVQLAVSNLLDEDDFIEKISDTATGLVESFGLQQPRKFILSTRLDF